jgi:hypothetical protein
MTVTKVPRKTFTQTIDAVRWAVSGDDAEATAETRKRARLSGPDAVEFLHYVVITDGFASEAQRVRSATVLLETGGFLSSQAKETGLFREPDGTGNADDERQEA